MLRCHTSEGRFIRGLTALNASHHGCVATIGSFDGVHLGHQAILAKLKDVGMALGLPTIVIIFEPQPHEFFSRKAVAPRLMRLRDKVSALLEQGIDRVLCIKFDNDFRQLSAQGFIDQVLVERLGVAHLEVGDDFRFGCDRSGDFKLLRQQGSLKGYSVSDTPTFLLDDERVSSTRIRALIAADDLAEAARLLGKGFAVSGRVVYGNQLGRTLGVPTANLHLGRFLLPLSGVYAVKVGLEEQGQNFTGVANVGVKPTLEGQSKPSLEVHIFDFEQNIYGKCIRVEFCHKLRSEQKFQKLSDLKQQIQSDIAHSKAFFSTR